MSEVETKTRMSDEQYAEQVEAVKRIATIAEQIKAEVPNLKSKSVKAAFENSVSNIEKKCMLYSQDRKSFHVNDEEKELLRKIRAGEVKVSSSEGTTGNEAVGEVQEKVSGKRKH